MTKSFSQDNIANLASLIKKNSNKKESRGNSVIGIGKVKIVPKKLELTAEERLQKVKKEKFSGKNDLAQGEKTILQAAFKTIYFLSISVVFAFGVIKFGNAMILAFQDLLSNIIIILKTL